MITIYNANETDFSTLGLGVLEPTLCEIGESGGALWELTMEHPVSDDMRWTNIAQMRIIKAPAPVRETPVVEIGHTTVERNIYRVNTPGGVRLYLREGESTATKALGSFVQGSEVEVLSTNGNWSEVITVSGGAHGYMWKDYLTFVRTETEVIDEDTPSAIIETHQTRDQLFRISSVERSSTDRIIRVKAEHITYDLRGVVVNQEYAPENEPANVAVAKLLEYADHETDFTIYCGSADPVTATYTGRNILDCLYNPDDGIVTQAKLRVIRDNYEIFLLPEQARDIQAEIRYGHNLLKAMLTVDTSDIITRIVPKGTDKDGNDVYGDPVDSPRAENFPITMAKTIEYDIKDIAAADAKAKLQELAEADFGIIHLSHLDGWLSSLITTWTDRKPETDKIVNEYTTAYNDNTNPIIEALQAKFGDDSAADVSTIRTYQSDVAALLKRRQNQYFSDAERTWLDNMVVAVNALGDKAASGEPGPGNGLDAPTVSLDADFVRLELSPAYTAVANQYALHMYDEVPVLDEEIGIITRARMVGYTFDCLLNRYTETRLGDLEEAQISVYGYEIASGSLSGTKLIGGSVGGDKIQALSVGYGKFTAAAIGQLSVDAVQAIRADIRLLVAQQITTDQLYADLAAIAVAQITTANIDHANIQWAQIQNLAAEIASVASAEIGTAKISFAKIYDLVSDTAIITEGVGGQLYINRLAVTDANVVSLTAGALMLKASNGDFVRLIADGQGGVTTETVTVEGDNIASATIPGGKLIQNTITARELNVSQIFADQALVRAIKAANIDVADLFAAQATINALDSYIIQASTIQALEGKLNVWANDKISLAINNVQVGGTNLIRYSKEVKIGSDLWSLSTNVSTYADADLGFNVIWINQSGATSNVWRQAWSPLINLGADWVGKQVTISGWVYSPNYAAIDQGSTVGICFGKDTRSQLNWVEWVLTQAGTNKWGQKVTSDVSAPINGKIHRFSMTFNLNTSDITSGTGTFADNTVMWVKLGIVRNADLRFYGLKAEWGNKATAWSPAPEDPSSGVVNNSITIDTEGIKMSSSDVFQLDAVNGSKNSFINIHGLLTADNNGGLTAASGSFANTLSVGGQRVLTLADVGIPIKVSTSQPSGHGFIWLQPSSVTSVRYTGYTADSRNSTVMFSTSQRTITRSFAAEASNTLANGTFTYTLTFEVMSLSDAQLTGVTFSASATKSSTVSFSASSAITLTKYQTATITLTATSTTNLASNANAISVAITATASSYGGLYLNSKQYMTLTIAKSGGSGTQGCNVYYIP